MFLLQNSWLGIHDFQKRTGGDRNRGDSACWLFDLPLGALAFMSSSYWRDAPLWACCGPRHSIEEVSWAFIILPSWMALPDIVFLTLLLIYSVKTGWREQPEPGIVGGASKTVISKFSSSCVTFWLPRRFQWAFATHTKLSRSLGYP